MKKSIMLIFVLFLIPNASGQEEKVVYEYKKYENFDLGNLEVKGQLIAPGDISVRERDRKRFEIDLFSRKDFDPFINKDIESLR
jgi:hypothetical protein